MNLPPSCKMTDIKPLFGRRYQTRSERKLRGESSSRSPRSRKDSPRGKEVSTGTTAELYSSDGGRSRSSPDRREYRPDELEDEHADRMIQALESIEIREGHAHIPEASWNRFKRFATAAVFTKKKEKERVQRLKVKLSKYSAVENLEQTIAELQSHRVELMRELALKEKRFAESFSLKIKLQEILRETEKWSKCSKELYRIIDQEKKVFDRLRRGMKFLDGFPLVKLENAFRTDADFMREEGTSPGGTTASKSSSSMTENRILYRGSRFLSGRFCIVTIFNHVPGKPINGFSHHWPYAPSAEGSNQKKDEAVGLSAYFRQASDAMNTSDKSSHHSVILLVVVYDIGLNSFHMTEAHPTRSELAGRDELDSYIKHMLRHISLRKKGRGYEVIIPGTRPPMRLLFSGHRELDNNSKLGYFHILIYEFDLECWILRLFDNSCCKLHSCYVNKDEVSDDLNEEDVSDERLRCEAILARLQYNGENLKVVKSRQSVVANAAAVVSKNTKNTTTNTTTGDGGQQEDEDSSTTIIRKLELMESLKPSKFWPSSLVVNFGGRFKPDHKYVLLRGAVNPESDLFAVVLYDPLSDIEGRTMLEQVFCLSDVCKAFIEQEKAKKSKDQSKNTVVWEKIVEYYKKKEREKKKVQDDDTENMIIARKDSRTNIFDCAESDYRRAVCGLLEAICLDPESNRLYFENIQGTRAGHQGEGAQGTGIEGLEKNPSTKDLSRSMINVLTNPGH